MTSCSVMPGRLITRATMFMFVPRGCANAPWVLCYFPLLPRRSAVPRVLDFPFVLGETSVDTGVGANSCSAISFGLRRSHTSRFRRCRLDVFSCGGNTIEAQAQFRLKAHPRAVWGSASRRWTTPGKLPLSLVSRGCCCQLSQFRSTCEIC